MKEIPAIYCDIDGVLSEKFSVADYVEFGKPNHNMLRVIKTLSRDFKIVFITGRWGIGQKKVEEHIQDLLPGINADVFCKTKHYPGITAEYKVSVIKELEKKGYKFYIGFDDHDLVTKKMYEHGIFIAKVLTG